jgi:5-methylcytosine-specific restriction enzyme A
MECHHIIPISSQKDFPNKKLDNIFNLISLCPICHRRIHYASNNERFTIFQKMYKVREKDMKEKGFDWETMVKIYNKYYGTSKKL